ncbi:AMP-binding protein [Paenibacillus sp. GCM10027628]|uniref:AMP-binding protein n=1 Tax=Paenibacillus sp. GCM10027628 TaxID=3273413 RepID=UPI003631AAD7
MIVDKQRYEKSDFDSMHIKMASIPELHRPEGKLYAICMKSPFEIMCLLSYLRDKDGALLLLHGDTPLETAKKLAADAHCNYLVYGKLTEILKLCEFNDAQVPSLFQYSSGTTGEPKLIARTWAEIDDEINGYNQKLVSSATPIILVPVSHSYGLIAGLMAGIKRGIEPVVVFDKNPKFAIHTIHSFEKSIVYGVPFIFQLLDTMGRGHLRYDQLISSGAPLSESLLQRLQQTSADVFQQYGCTEAGCISIGHSLASSSDVGKPLPHIRMMMREEADGHDSAISPQEIVVMNGKREIYTRDLGFISEQGTLHVLGRMDDLINVSGMKVIPSEVERIIGNIHGVVESVVYRIQHKVWGEAVKALVVASNDIKAEEIRAWCMTQLPAYKVPSVIELVKEIPRLQSGKISRKLLVEQEWNK